MPRNIEIKARVDHLPTLIQRIQKLSDKEPEIIYQDDLFFNCANGRLKLRTFSTNKAELIFYNRCNQSEPTESYYSRSSTTSPETLAKTLADAFGTCGHVIKKRMLYLSGRTRIHVDQVENLGCFVELEVVLEEHETTEHGLAEAALLIKKLAIKEEQLIKTAYVDLQSAKSQDSKNR